MLPYPDASLPPDASATPSYGPPLPLDEILVTPTGGLIRARDDQPEAANLRAALLHALSLPYTDDSLATKLRCHALACTIFRARGDLVLAEDDVAFLVDRVERAYTLPFVIGTICALLTPSRGAGGPR